MKSRKSDEHGMVTAFAVVFAMGLLLFVGLVFDGGMILAAKQDAIRQAQSAARVGAQAIDIDAYRSSNEMKLNEEQATVAARQYLQSAGLTGDVVVTGDSVRVTVAKDQRMQILGIGGLAQAHVSGSGVATAEQG